GFRRRAVAVAGMTEKSSESESVHPADGFDELERAGTGIDSASVKANVHLDENVEASLCRLHPGGPSTGDVEMIHDRRDRRAVHQLQDPRRLHRLQRIRNANIRDSTLREDLRFADLRAADSGGAAIDLPAGDRR